ncbi:MAG: hypothetical protein JNM25_10885 [Planctomycetes bacterium]|nr:hypothetical protein [Planctomycetota bacterium]
MKKHSKKLSTLLLGAAVAGLMTATTTLTSCSGDSSAAERNGCNGPNGCGGKDKKEANSCSGPNGCNGHGTKPAQKN